MNNIITFMTKNKVIKSPHKIHRDIFQGSLEIGDIYKPCGFNHNLAIDE
jgi:hypothetical protein